MHNSTPNATTSITPSNSGNSTVTLYVKTQTTSSHILVNDATPSDSLPVHQDQIHTTVATV